MDDHSTPERPSLERDVLDAAAERIWREIRGMLPRHRYLYELGVRRNEAQTRELGEVAARIVKLKRRSARYREVLRAEAWARWEEERGNVKWRR